MKRNAQTFFTVLISIFGVAAIGLLATQSTVGSAEAAFTASVTISPQSFVTQGIEVKPGQGAFTNQHGTTQYVNDQLILKMSDAKKVPEVLAKYQLTLVDDSSVPAAPSSFKNTRTVENWDYYLVRVTNLDNQYLKEYFVQQAKNQTPVFDSPISAKTYILSQSLQAAGIDRVYLNEVYPARSQGIAVTPTPNFVVPANPTYGEPNWIEPQVAVVADAWKQIIDYKKELPGTGTRIAMIDNGFDLKNPDLNGKNLYQPSQNTYKNTKPEPVGYDFACKKYLSVNDTTPDNQHGTRIAATALGAANNDYGVAGVAPNSQLIALRATEKCESSTLYAWNVIKAIRTADAWGADVINMSFAFNSSFTPGVALMQRAVKNAQNHGVILVAAAGNENKKDGSNTLGTLYPANFDGVIAVGGAFQNQDKDNSYTKSDWSNYGDYTQVWANDVVAVTATPDASKICYTLPYSCSRFAPLTDQGTSYSAAIVSGAMALLKQIDPSIDASHALAAIYNSGAGVVTEQNGRYLNIKNMTTYAINQVKKSAIVVPVVPVPQTPVAFYSF